jgi:hypothetical protein
MGEAAVTNRTYVGRSQYPFIDWVVDALQLSNQIVRQHKRVAIFQIRSTRLSLFVRMSLAQNRRTLLLDML